MKKLLLIFPVLLISAALNAQSGDIDDLFSKYAEKKGFTSVYISGKMLSMLGTMGENPDNIMMRIKSIRILTENDSIAFPKINLYTELSKKIDISEYEELMVVQDATETTKFLIKQKGNTISELLVISGGTKGNSLISIRGSMNIRDLSDLSKTMGVDELTPLNDLDKKGADK